VRPVFSPRIRLAMPIRIKIHALFTRYPPLG
jgi:hypothetical protein